MKMALRIIVAVAIFFTVLEVSTYIYRRIYAEDAAREMVQQLCREQNYDLAKLRGPIRDNNNPRAYSWIYQDSTHHLELLVAYDNLYDGEVAIWDFNRKD